MLLRKVTRATYSTGLSQSFIDELLAKAKEATTTTAKEYAARPRSNRQKNLQRTRRFDNRGQNLRAGGRDKEPRKGSTSGSTSMKHIASRKAGGDKVNQPQFSGKTGQVGKGEDLLDILGGDSTSLRVSSPMKRGVDTKAREKPRRVPRPRPAQTRATSPGQITPKIPQESQYFYPEDPSPASLLKYSTNLFHCSASKLSNFTVSALTDSNFPVTRHPHAVPGADSFMVSKTSFNKYIPGHSPILQKEKLLKNLTVEMDQAKYDAVVRGKYAVLPELQKDSFNVITKNDSTKGKLLANSEVVRLSLLRNPDINADPRMLELLYKTCSGLEPVSSLLK